jgi:hypothetical protein
MAWLRCLKGGAPVEGKALNCLVALIAFVAGPD